AVSRSATRLSTTVVTANNRAYPCTRGRSRALTASTNPLPTPGKANNASTTTTPPSSPSTVRANCCSAGRIPPGSTCRNTTTGSDSPSRRTWSAYSAEFASITPTRPCRANPHTFFAGRATTGSTRTAGSDSSDQPDRPAAVAGSQPARTETAPISSSPSTNSGIALSSRSRELTAQATRESSRRPQYTPVANATGSSTSSVAPASRTVVANPRPISSATGAPVSRETPRSPRSNPVTQ